MTFTSIPNQLVPQSQKGSDFIKDTLMAIKSFSISDANSKARDIECWYMYHNIWNEKEFEYLTKVPGGTNGETDYYLPAKVRHLPLQRAKLNVLIGQQKHRPYQFSVSIADEEGIQNKQMRLIHNQFKAIDNVLTKRVSEYNLQISQIEQQRQELQRILQTQPTTAEEQQQQMQLQQSLPMIESQLETIRTTLMEEIALTEEDQSEIKEKYKYNKTDFLEDMSQKIANKLRADLHIESKSLKNFISHIVVGKQFYLVDYEYGDKNITFDTLNTNNVFYPTIEDIEWVQDGPWAMVVRMRSINYLINKYKLSKEEADGLRGNTYSNPMLQDFNTTDFGKSLGEQKSLYTGTLGTEEGFPEYKIWWRSCKMIQVKESPNPHDLNKVFTHYIDDEDKVINEGQLYWDNKKKMYIDKDTLKEWDKKDVINANKNEKLIKRYIDEIWEGTIIGDTLIKNAGPKKCRLYSNENYAWTILPIIGKSYNDITNRPYSLVWDTRDIQKSVNIINFHKELLLATSGVKGTIMDISQIPEGMSKREWIYYKKLGAQWIETVKKNGKISSYNQFGSYDDSVSPAIQYLDNMMLMLDDMMGNIIGVPRQRQAQVSNSDQVGTYQMALEQSNYITEIIYHEHDEVERRALEAALNLATKYVYNTGGVYNYKTKNLSVETFSIPPNVLADIDLKIDAADNSDQEKRLKELKTFGMQEYSKGILPFKDLIKLYSTDTVKELEKKFEGYMEEAYKLAQENAAASGQREIEVKSKLMQLQAELDAQMQTQTNKLKEMELQLRSNLDQMKLGIEQSKVDNDRQKHATDTQVKLMEIQSENVIESQYVSEQNRSNIADEKLRAIEIQMNMLKESLNKNNKSGNGPGKTKQHILDN